MIQKITLGRAFATVGLWTMASRVLGFARDIAFAAFLGAGPVGEAFWIAFSLPNMFRRIFAEGTLNTAFTPMFCKYLDDKPRAELFVAEVLCSLSALLIIFSALAIIFMPVLVFAMAAGFVDDARFDYAIFFGRIMFAYIFFISLTTLFSSILQATGRFAAAAASYLLLNVFLIAALAIAYWKGLPMGTTASVFAVLSGVAQLALVWWASRRAGLRIPLRWPRLTPDIRRLAIIAAPAALAGGVVQINLLVGRQVASFFDGAIAWFAYADRFYQLPLGVIGVSIGVVLLPELSRKLNTPNGSESMNTALSRSAEFALVLSLPAAVALFTIPELLISVLFERGAFRAADSTATAQALAIYALGLPAFVFQKVLQSVYFARGDTKRPFYYAAIAMGVNASIAIGLAFYIGYLGAAWATTLAAWTIVALLACNLNKEGTKVRLDHRFWARLWRIGAASLGMGVLLYMAATFPQDVFSLTGWRYLALGGLVAFGVASYSLLGRALGAFSFAEIRQVLAKTDNNA